MALRSQGSFVALFHALVHPLVHPLVHATVVGILLALTATVGAADRGADVNTALLDHEQYLDARSGEPLTIRGFQLGAGEVVDLEVERFHVINSRSRLVAVRADGSVGALPPPKQVLLRGHVAGSPDAGVFLALSPYGVQGYIQRHDTTVIVSTGPLERTPGVRKKVGLTDAATLEGALDAFCQTTFDDGPAPFIPIDVTELEDAGTDTDEILPCRLVTLAIETDTEFLSNLFGGDMVAATTYVESLVGAMTEIYLSQLSVEFEIGFLRLWSGSDPYQGNGIQQALLQFRDYWRSNETGVDRTVAHFLSGRNLGGGIAFVDVLCNDFWGYGLSANLNGFFPDPIQNNHSGNWDLVVVAHELGHNFGTLHTHDGYVPPIDNCGNGDCSGASNGTIMSYCHLCPGGLSNIALEFHPRVVQRILGVLEGVCDLATTCDSLLGACCATDGSCFDALEDNCFATGGSFGGVEVVCAVTQCATGACCLPAGACIVSDGAADCLGFGGFYEGDGTNCQFLVCEATYCAATATFGGGEYIGRVLVNTLDFASSASQYSDFTDEATVLSRGGSYPFEMRITGGLPSDIGGLWIDWNGDADFDDAGEELTTSWSGVGPYTMQIEVPVNAEVGTTRMRVRLQDTLNPVLEPCGASVFGEVEDYTVIVSSDPPQLVYCNAGSAITFEYISYVNLAAIDNESGPSGYSDFQGISTQLFRGEAYPFELRIAGGNAGNLGGLWIDWNRDADFDDEDETITLAWSGPGPHFATVVVPDDAPLGPTRLRVRIHDTVNPAVDPCGETLFGEVEDYSVSVDIPSAACTGDVDEDAVVGFQDLLRVLLAWGECPGCPEDLNDDGDVDFEDVLQLLFLWGPCVS